MCHSRWENQSYENRESEHTDPYFVDSIVFLNPLVSDKGHYKSCLVHKSVHQIGIPFYNKLGQKRLHRKNSRICSHPSVYKHTPRDWGNDLKFEERKRSHKFAKIFCARKSHIWHFNHQNRPISYLHSKAPFQVIYTWRNPDAKISQLGIPSVQP